MLKEFQMIWQATIHLVGKKKKDTDVCQKKKKSVQNIKLPIAIFRESWDK